MVRNPVGEVKSPVRISTISEFQSVAIPSMDQFKKPCECPEILIVDDTPFNILALRTVLKKHKLRIDSAASGEEAIEKVLEYEVNNMCNMNYSHK
jgi:PleD family two-component response regulator